MPTQFNNANSNFSPKETTIIANEMKSLFSKGVLETVLPEPGQIVYPIFLVPKPDGTFSMILNLKKFNDYVTYQHFKMDGLSVIADLMSPNCFMASLDFKDAYYCIPIAKYHRKYLRFQFNGNLIY